VIVERAVGFRQSPHTAENDEADTRTTSLDMDRRAQHRGVPGVALRLDRVDARAGASTRVVPLQVDA